MIRPDTGHILTLSLAPAFQVFPFDEWRSLSVPRVQAAEQGGYIRIPCENCPPGNDRAILYISRHGDVGISDMEVHYYCGDHARLRGCPAEVCGDERADGGTVRDIGDQVLQAFYIGIAIAAIVVAVFWVVRP